MKLEEIKPGMVFRENDRRFSRWIRITSAARGVIEFDASDSAEGPFDLVRRKSRKPERFHAGPASSGYSLVSDP